MDYPTSVAFGGLVTGANIYDAQSPAYLGPAENGMNAYGDMSFEFSVVKRIGSNI